MKKIRILTTIMSILVVLFVCVMITVKAEDATYSVTANSGLCLRETAVNGRVLTVMPKYSKIVVTEEKNGWSYGTYGATKGWCCSKYLTKGTTATNNQATNTGNMTYIGNFRITGYVPWCTGTNLTCTGVKADTVIGKCVAVDRHVIPLGTNLYIEGIGYRTAMDTGVIGNVVDVLCATEKECYAITSNRAVYIVN